LKNLIKINLNQTVSKAQLDQLKEEKNQWIVFGVICSFFLISLFWIIFTNSRMNYIVENRQETIVSIKKETEELKKKGKINLSKKDVKELNKFEEKRMFWAPKLIELSKITPENMAITGLRFEGKRLKISAISSITTDEKDFDVVERFMKMIDENNEFNADFKDIKFESMQKEDARGQEVLAFTIEAKLK
jgi:Tfp pilus assembly protein PilN